jgi:asparagine synthase (glutamine-hydrolysing)
MAEFDESEFARQVAALAGTDHHEFTLRANLVDELPRIAWHADEPFAVSSSLGLYCLARLAHQHVKVVLSGDGGDELFAGYPWRHGPGAPGPASLARRLHGLAILVRSAFTTCPARWRVARRAPSRMGRVQSVEEGYVESLCVYRTTELRTLLVPDAFEEVNRAWAANVTQQYYDRYPDAEELDRKLYADVKSTLVSEMLTKVDRMTMAFGLEARVPFLDHHLVEWAFQLPGEHKIQGREGKLLVKKAMEKYLPRTVLYRPKHGFNLPLKLWMRDQLRDYVRDILNGRSIRARGLFRPEAVEQILRRHEEGVEDASNKIFVLLMTELWFRWYVDGRDHILRG